MLSTGSYFIKQFKRECLLNFRQPQWFINASLFLIIIIVLFPLTIPPNMPFLKQIIPGIIWIAVLLALLLASDRLFLQDYEEGVIEQWLVSGAPISVIVGAKITAQWLLIISPLFILMPFLAFLFHFTWIEVSILLISLMVGTPAMLALCALTAAFSIGLHQKGIMMALILLPLTLPMMIFGSSCLIVSDFSHVSAIIALLLALSLISVCFLPFAISAVIRICMVV